MLRTVPHTKETLANVETAIREWIATAKELDTKNLQTKSNEFGAAGWELVTVSMGNMTEPRLTCKKQE
ncbi:MAG: hypothetical protein NZM29_04320 [Nitrospira sp.]|nr:hypothetical protein [Nitrospira sp.]